MYPPAQGLLIDFQGISQKRCFLNAWGSVRVCTFKMSLDLLLKQPENWTPQASSTQDKKELVKDKYAEKICVWVCVKLALHCIAYNIILHRAVLHYILLFENAIPLKFSRLDVWEIADMPVWQMIWLGELNLFFCLFVCLNFDRLRKRDANYGLDY